MDTQRGEACTFWCSVRCPFRSGTLVATFRCSTTCLQTPLHNRSTQLGKCTQTNNSNLAADWMTNDEWWMIAWWMIAWWMIAWWMMNDCMMNDEWWMMNNWMMNDWMIELLQTKWSIQQAYRNISQGIDSAVRRPGTAAAPNSVAPQVQNCMQSTSCESHFRPLTWNEEVLTWSEWRWSRW